MPKPTNSSTNYIILYKYPKNHKPNFDKKKLHPC